MLKKFTLTLSFLFVLTLSVMAGEYTFYAESD